MRRRDSQRFGFPFGKKGNGPIICGTGWSLLGFDSFGFKVPGSGIVLDAYQGFSVEDDAVVDEPQDFGEGDEVEFDALVVFGLVFAEGKTFGKKDLHPFAKKAGAGEVADKGGPFLSAVASLFDELALGGGQASFVAIDFAGGQFPQILPGGVAVLTLHDDERVALALGIIDGEDDDRSAMGDEFAGGFDAVGLDDVVIQDFEELALVFNGRRENLGGLRRGGLDCLSGLRGLAFYGLGFGHRLITPANCDRLLGRFRNLL
jgi:hypothetical protein